MSATLIECAMHQRILEVMRDLTSPNGCEGRAQCPLQSGRLQPDSAGAAYLRATLVMTRAINDGPSRATLLSGAVWESMTTLHGPKG